MRTGRYANCLQIATDMGGMYLFMTSKNNPEPTTFYYYACVFEEHANITHFPMKKD